MKAALQFWSRFEPAKPHIAILGDMLELGDKSEQFHKEIGQLLSGMKFAELITVGNLSKHFQEKVGMISVNPSCIISHYSEISELLAQPFLAEYIGEVVVLIKASHGMHLEKVIPAIQERITGQQAQQEVR
jgi:UDP-N-acetylmuramoyl-tripeptide--D-alanyl-D-alanine ligase